MPQGENYSHIHIVVHIKIWVKANASRKTFKNHENGHNFSDKTYDIICDIFN